MGPQISLNKGAGFQRQRTQVADGPERGRQMDIQKIPGRVRMA